MSDNHNTPTAPAQTLITTHNCWAVYKSQPLKSGNLWTEAHRPPDWGDTKWKYRIYAFEATINDQLYRNIAHCWVDEVLTDNDAKELFKDLILMIMLPGQPEQACSNTHLLEDDFWEESWGKMPPQYYNDDEEEYEGEDDD